MDGLYVFILVAVGLASGLMVWGLYAAWQGSDHDHQKILDQRIHQMFKHEQLQAGATLLKVRALSRSNFWHQVLLRIPGSQALARFLRQMDSSLDVSQVLLLEGLMAIAAGGIGLILDWPFTLTSLLMAFSVLGVAQYLRWRHAKRLEILEKQLPDALDLMVRAQQSGHAFHSALQITATESAPPLSLELRKVFEEINLGISMQSAMVHLAESVDSKEIRYFVVAVLIQSETGGNLAEVLKKTASLIRERQKLAGVVRVLSAEGRISAWILSVMPFLLAFLLYIINPTFISALWTDPMGWIMSGTASGLMVLGIIWMSRLVRIKV